MNVAGPQTRTEEEAFVDAGHQRMIAAHAVVSIVRAAGLVAVDDLGEGVEIDAGLLARKSEEWAHDCAQDVCEARPVLVTGKRVQQPRQRGLRAQALRQAGIGGAQRAVASPLGDREPQGWIGVQQRHVVLVAPPLDQGEESRAHQLEEGVHDLAGSRGSSRCFATRSGRPSFWLNSRIKSTPASAVTRSGRASISTERLHSSPNSVR
jgi:hypothetical protein